MASLSGSGGKIQPQRPSPYVGSPPLALPPPPPSAGSPRWLLGLVSGAGKLISSVFRADSGSPGSSDYSSDQDRSSSRSRSDEQNIDVPNQLHGSSRELNKSEEIADCMEVSHAIVPGCETKLAIEKLLQQETFSRDECERLTRLLQSRVVDSPSVFVQEKVRETISNGLPGNAVDFSGAWLSLQQCNALPGSDVHDDALPVDLAKSYMQSLPPQQSPSVGNITLSSMIASKEDLQTDSSNHARTSNSLSPIQDVGKPSSTVVEDIIIIDYDAPHESFISASSSKMPDDAKSQDQNLGSLHATDGSGHEFSEKGGSTESNVDPQLVSQGNKSFAQFSNGVQQTTDVAKVIKEHPSMDTVPAHKLQKVTKRKSIEHVSVSPRPRTRQQAKREGKVGSERKQ